MTLGDMSAEMFEKLLAERNRWAKYWRSLLQQQNYIMEKALRQRDEDLQAYIDRHPGTAPLTHFMNL